MVRKAVRSYSAIEAAFQKLDVKEQKIRAYFQPMSTAEKEAWNLGAANWLIKTKHRHADVLDWKDDSSALKTVDAPPGEMLDRARRLRVPSPRPQASNKQPGGNGRDQDLSRDTSHSRSQTHTRHRLSPTATTPRSRSNSPAHRAAPPATSQPLSAPASSQVSPAGSRPRTATCARPAADEDTLDVMPGGANAAALAVALQQASQHLSHPTTLADLPAAPPPARLLQKYAAANDLRVVSVAGVGAQIAPPISKRPRARADLHTASSTAFTDAPDNKSVQGGTGHPQGVVGGRDGGGSGVVAVVGGRDGGGSGEHSTLIRWEDRAGRGGAGAGVAVLPPMPAEHPHQQARGAVLAPAAEDQLILAVAQQLAADPALAVAEQLGGLTPQARLLYVGHACQQAAGSRRRPHRRSRSPSSAASSSGCSSPARGGSSRDASPYGSRPVSGLSRGVGAVHGGADSGRAKCASVTPGSHRAVRCSRPWSASDAEQQTQPPTGQLHHAFSSSPAPTAGHQSARHAATPAFPAAAAAAAADRPPSAGPAVNKHLGKPPRARPQSARPASAHATAHTPTSHTVHAAQVDASAHSVHSVTVTAASDHTAVPEASDSVDLHHLRACASPARQRPWSASPTATTHALPPGAQAACADACVAEGSTAQSVAGTPWVGHSGVVGPQCPPEQWVIPRRHPHAHLAVVTSKGQREQRRRASWAASAPMRPSSAPAAGAAGGAVRARVDCGWGGRTDTDTCDHASSASGSARSASGHTGESRQQGRSVSKVHHRGASEVLSQEDAAALLAAEQARRDLGIIEDDEEEGGDLDHSPDHRDLDHPRPRTHHQHRQAGAGLRDSQGSSVGSGSEGDGRDGSSLRGPPRSAPMWAVGPEEAWRMAAANAPAWGRSPLPLSSGPRSGSMSDMQYSQHTICAGGNRLDEGVSEGGGGGGSGVMTPTRSPSARSGALQAARLSTWRMVASASGMRATDEDAVSSAVAAAAAGAPPSPVLSQNRGGGGGGGNQVDGASQLNLLRSSVDSAGGGRPPLGRAGGGNHGPGRVGHELAGGGSAGGAGGLIGAWARETAGRHAHGTGLSHVSRSLGQVHLAAEARHLGPSTSPATAPPTDNVAAWLEATATAAAEKRPQVLVAQLPTDTRSAGARGVSIGESQVSYPTPPEPAVAAAAAAAAGPAWAKPPMEPKATDTSATTRSSGLRWKDQHEGSPLPADHMGVSGGRRVSSGDGEAQPRMPLPGLSSVGQQDALLSGEGAPLPPRKTRYRSPGSVASSMRERSLPSPDDPALYQITAQVQTAQLASVPASLAGWRFNFYVTDLGRNGSSKGVRYCVVRSTTCDSQRRLLVPVHGDMAAHEERDDAFRAHQETLTAPSTATLSLSHLLPWVRKARDLYLHWVRLEAYAVMPQVAKVLDACVFLCGPEDDVPGAAPDTSNMTIREYVKDWKNT